MQKVPAPSQINPTITVTKTFRFKATVALVKQVIANHHLARILSIAGYTFSAATLQAYPLSYAVKLHRIQIYGPMASDLAPVTAELEWLGSNDVMASKSNRISDTSMSASACAYVSGQPPKNSIVSQWTSFAPQADFVSLTCPINSIIDITIEMSLNDGENNQYPITTVKSTTAPVGTIGVWAIPNMTAVGYATL